MRIEWSGILFRMLHLLEQFSHLKDFVRVLFVQFLYF